MAVRHAYLIRSPRRIEPFGRLVGEMRVHNRPLAEYQESVLRGLGLSVEWIDDPRGIRVLPSLVAAGDLYFTSQAVEQFLRTAEGARSRASLDGSAPGAEAFRSGNLRAALAVSELTEYLAHAFQGPVERLETGADARVYDLYYLRSHDSKLPLLGQSRRLAVPHRVRVKRVPAHRLLGGGFGYPICPVFLQPVRHWTGLLNANALGFPGLMMRQLSNPMTAIRWAACVLWRGASLRPATLRGKQYLAGRGCKVDPTAHVEHAILGDRVQIGPHAYVRGSVIGDRARIEPSAVIEGSTVGAYARVAATSVVRGTVMGDGADTAASILQLSVLGNGATLCPQSGTLDAAMRRVVRVMDQGAWVPSGTSMLGSCFGDDVFIGPRVYLAAGQSVPNGCILLRDPAHFVQDVNQPELPGMIRIERKTGRRAA
jgi:acetyltransferase-like isoleucine patch superfamily enzyme